MNAEQWRQSQIRQVEAAKARRNAKRNARAKEIRELVKQGRYKPKPRHTNSDYRLCRHPACRAKALQEIRKQSERIERDVKRLAAIARDEARQQNSDTSDIPF